MRRIPRYTLLGEEEIDEIEAQADWLLSEIGIRIPDDPVTLQLFGDAGATIKGDRVRFDPDHVRTLCRTAPSQFTMHARNADNNVVFGGDHVIMAPADGAPFVTDIARGRRYGGIEDHRNLTRLLQNATCLQHNPAVICEPSDLPTNKRHLDMLYSQLRYSDKAIMGAANSRERAEDTLAIARIVFGDEYLEEHTVVLAGTAVQSPLTFNADTTAVIRVYAGANQANLITPFIIAGAMSPTTMAGTLAQAHAEAMTGIALSQLVRRGAPAVYSVFVTTMDLQSGAPTFGTPESTLANMAIVQLAKRLGLPVRCGGHLTASKTVDAQSMQESVETMNAAVMAGANYILQAAGWLEGGLCIGFEKFVIDAERCASVARMLEGMSLDENGLAGDAFRELGDSSSFLGGTHTLRNFATANFRARLPDIDSFEQWTAKGCKDMSQRAYEVWQKSLADYEEPAIDPGVDEALLDFIARRKASMEDAWY